MPTEDELYRASSQYRHWNFTSQKLAALRQKTNTLAVDHVRLALKRKRTPIASGGTPSSEMDDDVEIDFLTVEEEKALTDFHCQQLLDMAQLDTVKFPVQVNATAIQYIKRFYITNSVMSYHPRQIMITALYLATKTENHFHAARGFAAKLAAVPGLEATTPESVLAAEYLLVQGLRFCFDVRHPLRALKGVYMELQGLLSIARGDPTPMSWGSTGKGLRTKLQSHLIDRYGIPTRFSKRIETAYARARDILQRQAILSDVYFLYTPSQIMMAAVWTADDKLVQDLLHAKASVVPDNSNGRARATIDRILDEIEACSNELQKTNNEDSANPKEAKRIDRKLHKCRDPDKVDLLRLNQATKRDAADSGKAEDKMVKKRKLEREALAKEGDDLFGPALTKRQPKND